MRLIELCIDRGPAIADKPRLARPGDGADDLRHRIDPAYAVVAKLDEKEIAGFIPRHVVRLIQRGRSRGTTIAGVSFLVAAGVGLDLPIGHHPTNAVIIDVADIKRPVRPARYGVRIIELRRRCGTAVTGKSFYACAGNGGNRGGVCAGQAESNRDA